MSSVDEWEKVIKSSLKKGTNSKHIKVLSCNLIAVNIGLKPCYLWDVPVKLDIYKINQVLSALKASKLLSENVVTFELSGDYFSCNLKEIENLFDHLSETKFVDCSLQLDTPKVIENWSRIHQSIKEFMIIIRENFNKEVFAMEEKTHWCSPTLYGFLLGYPYVYWSSSTENNLSLNPLYLFKVNYSSDSLKLDSVYSFTAPTCVAVSSHVECWLARLNKKLPGLVTMTTSSVSYLSVVL